LIFGVINQSNSVVVGCADATSVFGEKPLDAARDGWWTVAGIRSTGLTASLGLANHVLRRFQESTGVQASAALKTHPFSGAFVPSDWHALGQASPLSAAASGLAVSAHNAGSVASPVFAQLLSSLAESAQKQTTLSAASAAVTPIQATITVPSPCEKPLTHTFTVTHPLTRLGLSHNHSPLHPDPYPSPHSAHNPITQSVHHTHQLLPSKL
jgi:hypothetical protein